MVHDEKRIVPVGDTTFQGVSQNCTHQQGHHGLGKTWKEEPHVDYGTPSVSTSGLQGSDLNPGGGFDLPEGTMWPQKSVEPQSAASCGDHLPESWATNGELPDRSGFRGLASVNLSPQGNAE